MCTPSLQKSSAWYIFLPADSIFINQAFPAGQIEWCFKSLWHVLFNVAQNPKFFFKSFKINVAFLTACWIISSKKTFNLGLKKDLVQEYTEPKDVGTPSCQRLSKTLAALFWLLWITLYKSPVVINKKDRPSITSGRSAKRIMRTYLSVWYNEILSSGGGSHKIHHTYRNCYFFELRI